MSWFTALCLIPYLGLCYLILLSFIVTAFYTRD